MPNILYQKDSLNGVDIEKGLRHPFHIVRSRLVLTASARDPSLEVSTSTVDAWKCLSATDSLLVARVTRQLHGLRFRVASFKSFRGKRELSSANIAFEQSGSWFFAIVSLDPAMGIICRSISVEGEWLFEANVLTDPSTATAD